MDTNKTVTTASEVSSTPKPKKYRKQTMDTNKTVTTASEVSSTPKPKKSYVPTSQTGLQDYSYWCEYVKKHAKAPDPQSKPFRRGRIWT
ncbi:MAG: cyanobactin biosynthesis PatC/TenC/TruC family protein [Oscillatoriales cyanobacterium]|nr:MAG: cyanobactin biosynthesis PatC/TenC/TruC family protein [Oscillatoriales cyanobacterium]TAG66933.1 MAG: cyanobactin biosynthesis PatC/TenC/TruC family protein [Oscillatoriales cyanobacterium]